MSLVDLKKSHKSNLASSSGGYILPELKRMTTDKKSESVEKMQSVDLERLTSKLERDEDIPFDVVFNKLCNVQDSLIHVIREQASFSFFKVFYMKADPHKISLPLKMAYIR